MHCHQIAPVLVFQRLEQYDYIGATVIGTVLLIFSLLLLILINAKGFNYLGKGDLDKAVFDLKTKAQIESFDFSFENEPNLKNKKVNAELNTKINL